MKTLIINDELKTLLPPLSAEEYAGLEASILKDGCLSPLIVWNGILVDGHYRYAICTKHNISFSTTNVVFGDLGDAKLWAWKHQENRRNLTPFHRAELALKLKYVIAAKAKERQRMGGGRGSQPLNGDPIETRQELAEVAGISHGTFGKVEYIAKHADEETKEKLRQGMKGTSISKEYNRLKIMVNKKRATRESRCPTFSQTGKYKTIRVHKDTIPVDLALMFLTCFSLKFLRAFAWSLVETLQDQYGDGFRN